MFISIIAFAAGMINVPIVLLFAMITVINQMMYHTIENPDMKLVNELTLAKDQAEKANHAKSDFLASMSHELKTPLNSIIGLTDVMSDCYDIDEIHTDLKDISSSSRKLLELVDGILTINTLDSNDIQIINSEYSFKSIIDDLDNSVSLRIGDKPIEFRKKISSDLPNTLYGDKDKVKTIINHLVSNAIKYTNEGVVELSIDSIVIKDKCNLRITVTDTGVGIKEEDLANIFDKFYRSEENKDSDISGTGLGLSITKSIVDLMEGKITVNSTVGVGTTFTVTLSQKVVESNNNQEAEIL
jgi:signal transduction histidine kinase